MPRYAAANKTINDLSKRIKDYDDIYNYVNGEYAGSAKVMKDLSKIELDFENADFINEFNTTGTESMAHYEMIGDFPVVWCAAGGDWQLPVVFCLYIGENNEIRGYIPSEGNVYDHKNKCAYTGDDEISYTFDANKLREDVKNRIQVKNNSINTKSSNNSNNSNTTNNSNVLTWKDLENFLNNLNMKFDNSRSESNFNPNDKVKAAETYGICFNYTKDKKIWVEIADPFETGDIELVFQTTHYFDDEFMSVDGNTLEELKKDFIEMLNIKSCNFNYNEYLAGLDITNKKYINEVQKVYNWMEETYKTLINDPNNTEIENNDFYRDQAADYDTFENNEYKEDDNEEDTEDTENYDEIEVDSKNNKITSNFAVNDTIYFINNSELFKGLNRFDPMSFKLLVKNAVTSGTIETIYTDNVDIKEDSTGHIISVDKKFVYTNQQDAYKAAVNDLSDRVKDIISYLNDNIKSFTF